MTETNKTRPADIVFAIALIVGFIPIAIGIGALFYFILGNFLWNFGAYHWDKIHHGVSGFEAARRFIYACFFFLFAISTRIAAVVVTPASIVQVARGAIAGLKRKTQADSVQSSVGEKE